MRKRVKASLQETLEEYRDGAEDLPSCRRRSLSELTDFVEKTSRASSRRGSATVTPASMFPQASPTTAPEGYPAVPEHLPPLVLPPIADEDSFLLPAAADEGVFLEHDGLFDHEQLMQAIYLSQGLDFFDVHSKAQKFLQDIGLRYHDLGVKNTDEDGRTLVNQCFYLSIAHGYLGQLFSDEVPCLALRLKRAIEASVLSQRPSWAAATGAGTEGEAEAMAFADFLPLAMHASDSEDEPNILGEMVVCILDSSDCHVEVYVGPKYADLQDDAEALKRNLILLWYTPGHYQCLVCDDHLGSKVEMTYEEFKEVLTQHGVMYIETTE